MAVNNLLKNMNSKQLEAVKTTQGPLLVVAGAGSGKTRVLTHRVAYLIEEKNVNPWNILAITFTNKAAREMRDRIDSLMEEKREAQEIWVSTFHSLCGRILRRDAEKIGYTRSFTITNSSEQKTLMKHVLRELNIDPKAYEPKTILSVISNAKNDLIEPRDYQKIAQTPFEKIVAQAYDLYQQKLRENQAMDFDDMISQTIRLFRQEQQTLEFYQEKFKYIHVDEYQDTNQAQYELVSMLAKKYRNICVVGDADQSIYGWRGANMDNILNFENDYPDATVIKLEQNYRSTKTILKAANEVIENNVKRKDKTLWTDNKTGEKIKYYRAFDGLEEANYIIRKIKEESKRGRKYSDFAILYRTNAQSRVFEQAFRGTGISYKLVGAYRFYDRKEVMDIIAYLRLVVNPSDSLSFNRIVNEPKRGIGATSLLKLQEFSDMHGFSLLEGAKEAELSGIRGKARVALSDFANLIEDLHSFAKESKSITKVTEEILKRSGYKEMLEKDFSTEGQSRLENVNEFLSVTKEFDNSYDEESEVDRFTSFLEELALVSDQDSVNQNDNVVTLMTLHAAKGLEFPIVFLAGLEDGIFPTSRANDDLNQLEEERRLAYVGITRAEDKLYMTNALSRMLYGRPQTNEESRFVGEIDNELLDRQNNGFNNVVFNKKEKTKKTFVGDRKAHKIDDQNKTGANKKNWKVGDKIKHASWGIGTVVKISGDGEDVELDIAFKDEGIKRVLAAYAPVKHV